MKKIIALSIILITLLSCTSCDVITFFDQLFCDHSYYDSNPYKCRYCFYINEEKCEPVYQKLVAAGADLSTTDNHEQIEEYLNSLPNEYKHVSDYRELYDFVCEKRTIITIEEVHSIMQDYYGTSYVNWKAAQNAYLSLIEKGTVYGWNIKSAGTGKLSPQKISGLGGEFALRAFALGSWRDDNGNYFTINQNNDNKIQFSSNLPTPIGVIDSSYSYMMRGELVTIAKTENPDIRFDCYRVSEITRNYIMVYCFSNGITYKLNNEHIIQPTTFFIVDTSLKKCHNISCSHLPDLENEKRISVTDYYYGEYSSYAPCGYCH